MNFSTLDLSVLIIYMAIVLFAGLFSGNTSSWENFYLGGRRIHWSLLMLSIVATETSSLTFLSIPGISYKGNIAFLQVAFGYILGRILVALFLLPLYYSGEYTSVYQWIGKILGPKSQKAVSGVFLFNRLLGDGIRLYATSLPLALIFYNYFGSYLSNKDIGIMTLFIISLITVLYTVWGGFRSVVVADSIQFFVYVAGGLFAFFHILYSLPENAQTYPSEKLNIFLGFEGNFFQSPYFFINGVLGGTLLSLGSHGADQMFAQRLLACKNINDSKKALIGSGVVVFFQFLLFLWIGLELFRFYGPEKAKQDEIFSIYIISMIPSPILGILIAAILASAMSTLSSSINSMALTFHIDWGKAENMNSSPSKLPSFFWGFMLFLSSLFPYFLSGQFSEGLVEIGLKVASFTYGPMLAMFFLSPFTKNLKIKLPGHRILVPSLLIGILSTIWISYSLKPAMVYIILIGGILFYIALIILSIFSKHRFR